jgi:hypothetical protein
LLKDQISQEVVAIKVYSQLQAFFKQLAPNWRKTQLVNLTILASAILSDRKLCIAQLARSFPSNGKPKVDRPKHKLLHRLKRLRRFLDNPRLDMEAVFTRLTRLVCSTCRTPGLLLPVLLDPTYFGNYTTLVASVPYAGRALPIAWRVFRRDLEGEPELSQSHIVEGLIHQMLERLNQSIQVIVIADQEYASASFFRFLKGVRANFAIRVDMETWIRHPLYAGPMGSLPVKPGGKPLWLAGGLYGKEEREPVNLLALWEIGQDEPWLIATDLDDPKSTERMYRKRMKIEQGFRDWKHHLRLKGTLRAELPGRAARLITAVALLYWFICLIGIRVNYPEHQAEVSYWGKPSFFFVALQLIKLEHQVATRAAQRVVEWTADKLFGLQPSTPLYKLRYLRFRPWLLPQSGSL